MRQPIFHMLACQSCGTFLSQPVRMIVTYAQLQQHAERNGDGYGVEAGWFLTPNAGLRNAVKQATRNDIDLFDDVLNLQDLNPGAGYVKPLQRLRGCCGIDGWDGPNRVCTCGAVVGTEYSECIQTHRFIADQEKTQWVRLDKELHNDTT